MVDKIGRLKGTDIRARSARAVVALSIGTFAGRCMRFVRSMILARILAPDQIGTMAIIMSFSIAFDALTEVGVKQSIIQNKQGADTRYLNVAWWMQLIRASCLYAIAVLSAPLISSFYGKPELLPLLRVAFLAIALKGFVSPRAHVLEKEYKFGRAVFLIQGSAVMGAVISVMLALVMKNVWALVIGFVIEMATLCVLSFIVVPFLPRFEIDRSSLRELMIYARRMFGLPVLTMLSYQAPNMVLGKVISTDELGLYSYAALLTYIPGELYQRIISPVLLPAFSEKQNNKRALCRGLVQTTQWTAIFIIPLVAFMACCAGQLLLLSYGPRYVIMAVPLAVLSLNIIARSEAMIYSGVYLGIGMPHLQRRFAIIRAAIIIGLIYPAAARFGPLGAVAVIVLSNFSVLLMQISKAREVIDLNMSRYMQSYVPGLVMAIPIITATGLLWIFRVDSPLFVLVTNALVFILTFAVSVLILNHPKEASPSRSNPRIS
jgi:O-antigen/teichoic acid export membrane protein